MAKTVILEVGVIMSETRVKINENGRIVIPLPFRQALGINPGDEVLLRMENEELHITTQKQQILRAQRLIRRHADAGRSLSDELIAERRESAKSE
jgi:antitoxin PrlF